MLFIDTALSQFDKAAEQMQIMSTPKSLSGRIVTRLEFEAYRAGAILSLDFDAMESKPTGGGRFQILAT